MPGQKRKTLGIKVLSRGELLNLIEKIDTGPRTARDRCLIALEYLSGSRISELLWIKRHQIEKINKAGADFVQISNVKTLKRRKDKYRNVLMPVNDKDRPFLLHILAHTNELGPDDRVFTINRQRAWQIVKEHTGYFNHYFRHMRATHLTTDYGFSAQMLRKFFDWATSSMADNYSHLNMEDIAQVMAMSGNIKQPKKDALNNTV